jgi:hypothetical protein
MRQSLSPNTDAESFVVYRSTHGEVYHTRPTCATSPEVPPMIDLADAALSAVEMYRVGEIVDELRGSQRLCTNCAAELDRVLSLDN